MSNTLEPGSRLGKYQVLAHIATGGMGAIFKAVDVELRRTVALKVLPAEMAKNAPVLERFHREARHAARLCHANIVTLFESGHDPVRDLHYIALEFVDGIDLRQYIDKRGKLHPEEARLLLIQAAKALCHAFDQSIVHRDIKPSNFMLTKINGKLIVKLTDMGLARRHDEEEFRVTRDGNTVGTIDYISPEQARNSAQADCRSDIYSLGCTAYHMIAGEPPFASGGLGERLVKHLQTPPTDIRQHNPKVSIELWMILQKMLAKDPEDRYATPHELLRSLKSIIGAAPSDTSSTVLDLADGHSTVLVDSKAAMRAAAPEKPEEAAAPAPVEDESPPPPPRRKKKRPLPPRVAPTPSKTASPDQARTASAYHERALQVLAEGGGDDYARQLLVNCLEIDPFNTEFRQTLRDINVKSSGGLVSRWFGSLNVLAIKSKLRLARSSANWRKVLAIGEEILAKAPDDADTHIEMAAAAKELGAPQLAFWLLERGREQAPDNASLLKAIAQYHEDLEQWTAAASAWEKVKELDPSDSKASHKINDLLAKSHLAHGRRRR